MLSAQSLPARRLTRVAVLSTGLIVLLLLAALLAPAVAQAQSFTDVGEKDWFHDAVETLASQGAIGGYADGTFRPYNPVTRAQFAAMMAGVLHLQGGAAAPFNDVAAGDWFAASVGALYAIGVVQGGGDGNYYPAAEISRQQAASLAMRAVAYRLSQQTGDTSGSWATAAAGGGDETAGDQTGAEQQGPQVVLMTDSAEAAVWLQGFKDRAAIASAHSLAVANAFRAGVISGFSDQRFYPFVSLTRAQAAGILYKALFLGLTMAQEPPAAVEAEAAYPTLRKGDTGAVVGWVERRLAALSYHPGAQDGLFDGDTGDALMAFEKVERLERTGTATDAVLRRLVSAATPVPRRSLAGTRVEIDLTRQVLFLIGDGRVRWTIPVSTGKAGWRTPTGTFSIERKLPYWRESDLGLLYKPAYFHAGYAIHGSYSIPDYPASHGCVRVAVGTMDELYPLLPVGTRVDLYY